RDAEGEPGGLGLPPVVAGGVEVVVRRGQLGDGPDRQVLGRRGRVSHLKRIPFWRGGQLTKSARAFRWWRIRIRATSASRATTASTILLCTSASSRAACLPTGRRGTGPWWRRVRRSKTW